MGNAVGLEQKPIDASDITNLDEAKAEIAKIRQAMASVKRVDKTNMPKNFRKEPSCSFSILTEELYGKFCNVRGPRGYTFDQAIQCGLDGRSSTGLAIPDEESYYLWQEFYDLAIDKKHNGFPPEAKHVSDLDPSKLDTSKLPDDLDDYCVSTRIRAARNIAGFGLPPGTTRAERREVEAIVKDALTGLTGDLAGEYYGLANMTKEQEGQLQADHFLFQKPDPNAMIFSCGGCRDWPDARGIFHNKDKTFLVWVNEEDQMRVISMQAGGKVDQVFERWCRGVNAVEAVVNAKGMKWMYNDHVGMFSSCVSNVGTGLRASMHIKLPNILKAVGQDTLDKYCLTMRMQCRGTGGEHTEAGSDGKVDISNWDRIGKSEVELIQTMIDGIVQLISLDKRAKAGEDIKTEMTAAITASA
jgi:creatine kinase